MTSNGTVMANRVGSSARHMAAKPIHQKDFSCCLSRLIRDRIASQTALSVRKAPVINNSSPLKMGKEMRMSTVPVIPSARLKMLRIFPPLERLRNSFLVNKFRSPFL